MSGDPLTQPIDIPALYGGGADRDPRLVVNAVFPGDKYVVLSFDDMTGHRMALALTPDGARALRRALEDATAAVEYVTPKPKRLRCRASVMPPSEYRSHQCRKAATGTRTFRIPNTIDSDQFPVCSTHQRGTYNPYAYEPSSKYQAAVEEYMR